MNPSSKEVTCFRDTNSYKWHFGSCNISPSLARSFKGKYVSSDIYSSPRDPALRQEYNDYLKKRLEELRAGQK